MNKKITIALVVLLVGNVLAIGCIKTYYSKQLYSKASNLIVIQKNGKLLSLPLVTKYISTIPHYKAEFDMIALENILGDTTHLDAEIKSKAFNADYQMNMDNSEYNLLYNKALNTIKVNVTDAEVSQSLKDGTVQEPKKIVKAYGSTNRQSLITLQNKLKNKEKFSLPFGVSSETIETAEFYKDMWDVVGTMPDGNCSQIIVEKSGESFLAYNISTIPNEKRLKDAAVTLSNKKAMNKLDTKIADEEKTFSYKFN